MRPTLMALEDRRLLSTIVVNNPTDTPVVGETDLRQAIIQANTSGGAETIVFDKTVFKTPQTITLNGTQLELSDTTGTETITGPAAGVTVSGGGLSRVFQVDSGVTATLSGVTVSGGSTTGNGGGLFNNGGTTTLTNCNVIGNSAAGSGGGLASGGAITLTNCNVSGNNARSNGGGLLAGGTTTLTNCTVSANSAGGAGGIFTDNGGGLFATGTAALTDCTVSTNSAAGSGGGVYDTGAVTRLTLTDCTVSGNSAGNSGGGLANDRGRSNVGPESTLTNCTVSGNSAAGNGGGVYNRYGSTTLTNCTVSGNSAGNSGGGLVNIGGTAMLTSSSVSGNSAVYGGGVYNRYGSTTLSDVTVSGNHATYGSGGGVCSVGGTFQIERVTLTNCTVSGNSAGNSGGGLANIGGTARLALTNCTVSGNSAALNGGGVYSNAGTFQIGGVTLTNCTVSGNFAGDYGGGLFNSSGTLPFEGITLTNCTVSGNSAAMNGGGIDNAYGVVTIGNTIVAENTATTSGPDALGTFASQGNNLIGETDGSSGWVGSDLTGTIAQPLDPALAPLGYYGGPTQTMALLPGSPAIDAGNNALIPAGITTDQRGLPRIVNGIVDIGAFESSGFILVLDPSAGGALSLAGNASINFSGVVFVDSSSSSGLSASGNAQVTAAAIDVNGGVKKSGNASLSPTPVTGATVIADPLASLASPSTMGMTNYGSFSLSGNSSQTIQPGIYSQISVSGSAKLTMSSGIYIIEGGGFSVSGSAGVTGSGVMIFNAGSKYSTGTGGTYGSIALGGTGTYNLSPATNGIYAGIVLFQPVDNTKSITVTANGSGITGVIYAPSAQLSESGNGALDASSLIVDTLTISGNGVANSPPLAATSGVAGLTVTTPDLGIRGAPAASRSPCSSSPGLMAWDLALADASTTAPRTVSWVRNVSDAPGINLTRVVFDSPFSKERSGIGPFQA